MFLSYGCKIIAVLRRRQSQSVCLGNLTGEPVILEAEGVAGNPEKESALTTN
jgi:hypothetical protein